MIRRKRAWVCVAALWLLVVVASLSGCQDGQTSERELLDSLNRRVYQLKYVSLEQAMTCADDVLKRCERDGYRDGMHEALLNKGDVYGMGMDYDSAQICYQRVLEESNNELLKAVADVDMMSVCLMRSMSKDFYDYRSDALERFTHVAEETGIDAGRSGQADALDKGTSYGMTEHQRTLWNAVQTEYHFVSLNYFMKVRQDDGLKLELEWLEKNQELFAADTIQLSTYLFLQSMAGTGDVSPEEAADNAQRSLMRLLSLSRSKGYVYFEASALNGLARSMMNGMGMRPSRRVFLGEVMGENDDDSLVCRLVDRALELSRLYGNSFMETTVLMTQSDYFMHEGADSLALLPMERAIGLINAHHVRLNRRRGGSVVDTLRLYEEVPATISTEMSWIADPAVVSVPDWMAAVREQLSIVYGAMGRKAESDYNHNILFDILDATRQDLRVQQEEENLKREERVLNVLLLAFALVLAVLACTLIIYNKKSRRVYRQKVEMLGGVIDVCKRMSAALPDEVDDEEELGKALRGEVDADVRRLFPQIADSDWTLPDAGDGLKGLDRELFNVLLVFYEWMCQRGIQTMQFNHEMLLLESETHGLEKRLEENKRQYLEKLTSMSIVNGITPFLDRALHEVAKLKETIGSDDAKVRERMAYLGELVDKINEYNTVLGHWVKIRQGMVTLNVENFALQPLFDTMGRGTKTFDMKGVRLQVLPTEGVVKADRSLTIFMMNTLLDNARKYTPRGGVVTLSADVAADYVEIAVTDTGHGMSEADVELINNAKVYDSSKIGQTSANAGDILQNKGFGFGLLNCKGIIGRYQKSGKLFSVCRFGVESEEGKGSRFFFRLPKGVLKTLSCLLLLMTVPVHASGSENRLPVHLERAVSYADSVFASNVRGNHAEAIEYADSAVSELNAYYLITHTDTTHLMHLEEGEMGELEWWQKGIDINYELVISLRNEVAIAALAQNRRELYHYNSEALTRLYKLTSTDPTLADFCEDIRMANRNKKTIAILMGMLIVFVLTTYFFMHYRHHQLFLFNLRQFIQLHNAFFTAEAGERQRVLLQGLSDIKSADMVALAMPGQDAKTSLLCTFEGNEVERPFCESLMLEAARKKQEMVGESGHFRAFPLNVPTQEGQTLAGVFGVRFIDGSMTKEESLIVRLVTQFLGIHVYYSSLKAGEMAEQIGLKRDEHRRMEMEQQRVHVQNQILDNCLSTLRHETMYYPNRVGQLIHTAEAQTLDADTLRSLDEMLRYYKEIFTLLSSCASRQVERVLFRRVCISAGEVGQMAQRAFQKMRSVVAGRTRLPDTHLHVSEAAGIMVLGDRIFLQTLLENIVSLYFEHRSGGDLRLDFAVSDGFATFAFTDEKFRYADSDIRQLFYVENMRYDPVTDTLHGAQYMLCRQIIREHDACSPLRGCRVFVENEDEGSGSRFVFTLPCSPS